jgi:hypothetical protein
MEVCKVIWSYTSLAAFENCPRQGYARYIAKTYPFVETEAMREGKRVHKAFENRIKNDEPFPDDLAYCEQFIPTRTLDTVLIGSEISLGIDMDFAACGFFDSDCFFRGKLDLLNIEGDTAFIIDFKTGKPYERDDELQLHAMLAKTAYPDVKHWRGFYVWLRNRKIGDIHTLSPAVSYRKLLARVEKLQLEDIPKKNPLCPWCELMSCEFNPRRKK